MNVEVSQEMLEKQDEAEDEPEHDDEPSEDEDCFDVDGNRVTGINAPRIVAGLVIDESSDSLMKRLTEMKATFRDLTEAKCKQSIANIEDKVYKVHSFSPLDWEVVISSVSGELDVLAECMRNILDTAALALMGEEVKVQERQDQHARTAATVRSSFDVQKYRMRKAHGQEVTDTEIRVKASWNRDHRETEAKFRAQISDLQDRVEQLIQEKDDAVFEHEELLKKYEEENRVHEITLQKMEAQRTLQAKLHQQEVKALETKYQKLDFDYHQLMNETQSDIQKLKKAALLAHAKAEKTVEKQLDKKYTLLYKEEKDKVKDMKKELGRMTQLVSDFRQKMYKGLDGCQMTFDDLPEHERAMMLRTCLEAERELRVKEEGCSDMAGYKVKQTKDKKPKPIRADPEPTSKKAVGEVPPREAGVGQAQIKAMNEELAEMRSKCHNLEVRLAEAASSADLAEAKHQQARRSWNQRLLSMSQSAWRSVVAERYCAVQQHKGLLSRLVAQMQAAAGYGSLDELQHATEVMLAAARRELRDVHVRGLVPPKEMGFGDSVNQHLHPYSAQMAFRRHSIAGSLVAGDMNTMGIEFLLDHNRREFNRVRQVSMSRSEGGSRRQSLIVSESLLAGRRARVSVTPHSADEEERGSREGNKPRRRTRVSFLGMEAEDLDHPFTDAASVHRFSMTSAGTQTEPLDGWRHEASGPSFAVPTARDGARPDPRFATAPMPEAAEMPDLPKRAFYGGGFRANKEESVEADHRARRTPSFISVAASMMAEQRAHTRGEGASAGTTSMWAKLRRRHSMVPATLNSNEHGERSVRASQFSQRRVTVGYSEDTDGAERAPPDNAAVPVNPTKRTLQRQLSHTIKSSSELHSASQTRSRKLSLNPSILEPRRSVPSHHEPPPRSSPRNSSHESSAPVPPPLVSGRSSRHSHTGGGLASHHEQHQGRAAPITAQDGVDNDVPPARHRSNRYSAMQTFETVPEVATPEPTPPKSGGDEGDQSGQTSPISERDRIADGDCSSHMQHQAQHAHDSGQVHVHVPVSTHHPDEESSPSLGQERTSQGAPALSVNEDVSGYTYKSPKITTIVARKQPNTVEHTRQSWDGDEGFHNHQETMSVHLPGRPFSASPIPEGRSLASSFQGIMGTNSISGISPSRSRSAATSKRTNDGRQARNQPRTRSARGHLNRHDLYYAQEANVPQLAIGGMHITLSSSPPRECKSPLTSERGSRTTRMPRIDARRRDVDISRPTRRAV